METTLIKKEIFNYLVEHEKHYKMIMLSDLYSKFPHLREVTIRQTLIRFAKESKLIKIKVGMYAFPNTKSVISKDSYKISSIIEEKYLFDQKGDRIGYLGGVNFANVLGITTQTASIETVYSNAVSHKKRRISIMKHTIIVNAPRVTVTSENYKLLQVLDVLNQFDSLSELTLKNSFPKIESYFKEVKMPSDKIEYIVSRYPLLAQKNFYQLGVDHVITQSS